MPDAVPPEPVMLAAQAGYADAAGGNWEERAKAFRILRQERACEAAGPDVIVVCARDDGERYRHRPTGGPPPTAMEDVRRFLTVKLGPGEIAPTVIEGVAGSPGVAVTFRLRF